MTQTKQQPITIRVSTGPEPGPIQPGQTVGKPRTIEAEVHGDWAIHELPGVEWTITHVPTGLAVASAPSRLDALGAVQALQTVEVTATVEDGEGLVWERRAEEVAALRAALGKCAWYEGEGEGEGEV